MTKRKQHSRPQQPQKSSERREAKPTHAPQNKPHQPRREEEEKKNSGRRF